VSRTLQCDELIDYWLTVFPLHPKMVFPDRPYQKYPFW